MSFSEKTVLSNQAGSQTAEPVSGNLPVIPAGIQPDGDYVAQKADGQFFETTTTLAADATYTSDWFDLDGFGTLELFLTADVPSANKGVVIEWSSDVNAASPTARTSSYYEFNVGDVRRGGKDLHIRPKLDGFRLKYINGRAGQTEVYIACTGRVSPEAGSENTGNAIVVADFRREVALGNISNYRQDSKFGRNSDVDTAQPADIWNGGKASLGIYNYTGFNATANENLSTASSSASDVGALVSSGTITTTSATQVIDSSATFVTDGVAVGDIVLNDTRAVYGYVKSVDSETQLTVMRMLDGDIGLYSNLVGNSYRVATASSTGAAVVQIRRILNSDYERQTNVFVILNGTTAVTSTADAFRCSRCSVILAGSGGSNVGEITVRQATTTANIFVVMPAESNQSRICADTVPVNTVYLLEKITSSLSISGGVSSSGVVSLRIREAGGVFWAKRIYDLTSTGGPFIDEEEGGIPLGPGVDFKLRVDSVSSNNSRVSGKIEFLEIDEIV